jgi:hypothetical protein
LQSLRPRGYAVSRAIAALVTLPAMQELMRFFQSRFLRVHHVVRQPPRVMLWDGGHTALFGLPIPGKPENSPGVDSDNSRPADARRLP